LSVSIRVYRHHDTAISARRRSCSLPLTANGISTIVYQLVFSATPGPGVTSSMDPRLLFHLKRASSPFALSKRSTSETPTVLVGLIPQCGRTPHYCMSSRYCIDHRTQSAQGSECKNADRDKLLTCTLCITKDRVFSNTYNLDFLLCPPPPLVQSRHFRLYSLDTNLEQR